jgi:hypothetical protein
MVPVRRRSAVLMVGVLMLATACSSSTPTGSSSSSSSSSTGVAAAPPSSSTALKNIDYSTKFLDPPLDLDLPSFLDTTPGDEGPTFVTWGSPDGSVAVRVLRPVVVYAPGVSTTSPVPAEYVKYLLGQAHHGAHFVDRVETKVDGHDATVLTATTDESIDGSLGCPDTGTPADKCFGLQPEFSLRIGVITTDKGPLLIWLRSNRETTADLSAARQRFDAFLRGLHFAHRAIATKAASDAVDREYDATYTWTIGRADALAHGTADDRSPAGLAFFPNTFTATLKNGQFTLRETSTSDVDTGKYVASPGHLVIDPTASGLTADVIRDADGTLHLTAVPPILDPGGVFILTTEPWKPVR